jgi:carboxyl-terminal processing protease
VEVVLSADDDSKIHVQQTRADITDPKEFNERFGFTPIPDVQLQAALDVLKGMKMLQDRSAAVATR